MINLLSRYRAKDEDDGEWKRFIADVEEKLHKSESECYGRVPVEDDLSPHAKGAQEALEKTQSGEFYSQA